MKVLQLIKNLFNRGSKAASNNTNKRMNKKNLLKRAALTAGLPYSNEQKAVEAFLCAVSDILKDEKEVILPDFGKFSVQECAERNVRHPQTGEIVTIPAKKRVRFKPFGGITNYSRKHGV